MSSRKSIRSRERALTVKNATVRDFPRAGDDDVDIAGKSPRHYIYARGHRESALRRRRSSSSLSLPQKSD